MKINTLSKWIGIAVVAACCGITRADNQNLQFSVDIDTSVLPTLPNAPFYLDFQLIPGNSTLPDTATLSNFTFTGGAVSGGTSIFDSGGTAAGDMNGTITLNDGSGYIELFQGFTTSTSHIHFTVSLTQNSTGVIPDGFNVAILDSEPGNPQIPTTNVDGLSLVSATLGSSLFPATLANVTTGNTTGPDAGVTTSVSAVPEPSAWPAALVAAMGVAVVLRIKQRRSI